MKRLFLTLLSCLGFMLLGFMSSCSKDDEDPIAFEKPYDKEEGYGKAVTKAGSFSLIIKFEGETYNVPCTLENDSLIYLDEDFNALYKATISQIPELAALSYKDEQGNNVLEYYHSDKELEEKNGIFNFNDKIIENNILTKAAMPMIEPKAGRAILYDDTDFKDRTVVIDIDYDFQFSNPNLKDSDEFNDKTSAIRVFNFLQPTSWYSPSYLPGYSVKGSNLRTCLIGYEDSNYEGRKLYCIASYTNDQNLNDPSTASHQDSSLKYLGWNDKISSVVFRIITVDLINSGGFTPHD